MDNLTPEQRSQRMALVRNKNTKPEMVVRRLVHAMGYRYRLHRRDLPGTPDLVFPKLRRVIFVHGCFWHQHVCPLGNRMPKSRVDFWNAKLLGNKARDRLNLRRLRRLRWQTLQVYECELRDVDKLMLRLLRFLDRPPLSL